MTKSDNLSFAECVAKLRSEVDQFEAGFESMQDCNGLEMPYPDWFEQFLFYMNEVADDTK